MSIISIVSVRSVAETQPRDQSFRAIALFCGFGLLVTICLASFGIDIGSGLF